jgi:hypothetical protein
MSEGANEDLRGEWWLPSEPSSRVLGTLQISPFLGPQLSLDRPLPITDTTKAIGRVDGAAHGDDISLLGVRRFLSGFLPEQELLATDAVVGAHLGSDPTFAQAALEFDVLTEWMAARALSSSEPNWSAPPGTAVVSVSYTAQPIEEICVASPVLIRLRPLVRINYERDRFTLAEKSRFEVVGDKLQPLDIAAKFIGPFQDFLAFAASHPASVAASWLRLNNDGDWLRWHRRWRHPKGDPGEVRLGEFLFRRSDLGVELGRVLTQWWALSERLRGCLDLLISLLYGAPEYIDTELLVLAQAAEAYHRGMYERFRWPPEDFTARKASVLDRFGANEVELREWLEGLLEYANEPTLASRLTDIEKKARSAIPEIFDAVPDWAKRLRRLRNSYTHRGAKPIQHAAGEIRPIVRLSKIAIQTCILIDLGLDASLVGAVLRRTGDYSWAMSEAHR